MEEEEEKETMRSAIVVIFGSIGAAFWRGSIALTVGLASGASRVAPNHHLARVGGKKGKGKLAGVGELALLANAVYVII